MDGLSVIASIIAVVNLTTEVVSYLSHAVSASKDRDLCAIEASNVSNLLVNLRFRLEEGRCHEDWYTAIRALTAQNGPLDQYRATLEMILSRITVGGHLETVKDAIMWKFSKKETAGLMSRIERLKTLIQIALEMDQFKLSQAIKHDVSLIRDTTAALEGKLDVIQHAQDSQKQQQILDWLSPISHSAKQSDVITRKQEGTGQWFLNSHVFTSWFHKSNATLLCPGMPGAGKTIMAANVIDHISKKVQDSDIGLAYIYFNYKTQDEQCLAGLFCIILRQLLQARPTFSDALQSLYEKDSNRTTRPSSQEVFDALLAVLIRISNTYIIVDAWDECSDNYGMRRQFQSSLRRLQERADVRLMVTSRSISDLTDTFPVAQILEIRASNEDVNQYVAGQISILPGCVRHDKALQTLVQKSIAEVVDGMFLLARFHVEALRDQRTKAKIMAKLATLPKGSEAIDHAYVGALERINSQLPEDVIMAKQVLTWITCARTLLTTQKLRHALAVKPGEMKLNLENIPDLEDILYVCAGLVTVDEESGIIGFVHNTTYIFFERILHEYNPTAELTLASTCLTYLCFEYFASGSCSSDIDFENRLRQNILLDYAARYWGRHALTIQNKINKLALTFLLCDERVSCAVQAEYAKHWKSSGYSQNYPHRETGLHAVAKCGLSQLAEALLIESGDAALCLQDSFGYTPLSIAALSGHDSVVEVFLERGQRDINMTDALGRTPLWSAVETNQAAVVKLLLKREDIQADLKDDSGSTPLLCAAVHGRQGIAELLLKREDIKGDSKDENGRTPLSWAVGQGYEGMVKMLIERDDVEVNSPDKRGRTPLYFAAKGGLVTIVKMLLGQHKISLHLADHFGDTPLSWAARIGHEEIVRLLVEHNTVTKSLRRDHFVAALFGSALNGNKPIVDLLDAHFPEEEEGVDVEEDDVDVDTDVEWNWNLTFPQRP